MSGLVMPKGTWRRRLILTARAIVAIGLIYLIFRNVNWESLLDVYNRLEWYVVSIGTASFLLSIPILASRWHSLLNAADLRVDYQSALVVYWEGVFFSNFLPTKVGGDVYRIQAIWRSHGSGAATAASVFVERLIGGFTMVAVATILALALPEFSESGALMIIAVAASGFIVAGGIVVLWVRRKPFHNGQEPDALSPTVSVASFVARGRQALRIYSSKTATLLRVLVLSLIVVSLQCFGMFLLLNAMGLSLSVFQVGGVFLLGYLAGMVPLSLSGVGLQEGAQVVLFGYLGVAHTDAIAAVLLIRALLILISLPGGLIYLGRPLIVPKDSSSIKGEEQS